MNNYSILVICCVLNNFRKVRFQNNEHAPICDAVVFCYFGCSMPSSKNNDHVFHAHFLGHVLKIEGDARQQKSFPDRNNVILWIENGPTQCECSFEIMRNDLCDSRCQNFLLHKNAN